MIADVIQRGVPDSERERYLRTIAELTDTITSLSASFSAFREEQSKQQEQLRARLDEERARQDEERARHEQERLQHATQLEALSAKLDAALRSLHGKKSERSRRTPKMKSPAVLLGPSRTPEETAELRRNNRALIEDNAVDAGTEEHRPTEADLRCKHCGDNATFKPLGAGRSSTVFDYVPGYFRKTQHLVHSAACTCGKSIVSADGPARATPRSRYGPGLAAYLIANKFSLSMPIYRLEKLLKSHGIPASRSTLNALVNRTAELLRPIYDVLTDQVSAAKLVLADETPIKIMSHNKKGFIWVFLGDGVIVYKFADNRKAQNAVEIIGGTSGTLLTDGYSGYLPVIIDPADNETVGRLAAACLAHIRRKFHEALSTAPEAQAALDFILEVYRVEREVASAGLTGTEKHLWLRQSRAGPAMGHLKKWMKQMAKITIPKSPLGNAITYAINRWKPAVVFLRDARIPVDNNASERALRIIALGRKNFYGAGSKDGGKALEVLYSLISSCEAAGVEPFAYLQDVIARVGEAPATLTPKAWAASQAA